jgi:hypothetical protein
MNMDKARTTIRIIIFQSNKNPTISRNAGFRAKCGIPPPSVPAGHMYLQKYGGVTPVFVIANAGSKITNNSNTRYFK